LEKAMSEKLSWSEQYKHPKWQRKRLEALESAGWQCASCGDQGTTLNVHHKRYVKGRMVWEYEPHELTVLCEPCHETEHEDKELLNRLLMEIGPGGYRQAASLIGGYWDANCMIDPAIGDTVKRTDALYYELGLAAACLECMGQQACRDVVRRQVSTGPSTPTMQNSVEDWDNEK
jgi:hypothetical protein